MSERVLKYEMFGGGAIAIGEKAPPCPLQSAIDFVNDTIGSTDDLVNIESIGSGGGYEYVIVYYWEAG